MGLTLVLDHELVYPGTDLTGHVIVEREPNARSVVVQLQLAEATSRLVAPARTLVNSVTVGVRTDVESDTVPFALRVPLGAPPSFETRRGNWWRGITIERTWKVQALVDRPGFDVPRSRRLDVLPAPADWSASALVMPAEVAAAGHHPTRGFGSPQPGRTWWQQLGRTPPRSATLALTCRQPFARRGDDLVVEVTGAEPGTMLGLFCYERLVLDTRLRSRAAILWSSWHPPIPGTTHCILPVPPTAPPSLDTTFAGVWWDVRPLQMVRSKPRVIPGIVIPVIIRA